MRLLEGREHRFLIFGHGTFVSGPFGFQGRTVFTHRKEGAQQVACKIGVRRFQEIPERFAFRT